MLFFARMTRRALVPVALFAGIAACSSLSSRSDVNAGPASRPLSDSERVAHVLSRLTFGARPGDAEQVAKMGGSRWIDRQLRPSTINDNALEEVLASMSAWNQPTTRLAGFEDVPRIVAQTPLTTLMKDTSAQAKINQLKIRVLQASGMTDNFFAGRVARAQLSERQLQEVVSDFWENHFSVFSGKMPSPTALIDFDREALRPNALGHFRDLLGAVAHSPDRKSVV